MDNNAGMPEDRLLRLIRRGHGAVASQGVKSVSKFHLHIPLKLSGQKILSGILVLVILNFLYSLSYPFWAMKSVNLPKPQLEKTGGHGSKVTKDIRPFEVYLEGIRTHQLFSRVATEGSAQPLANIDTDLTKDYALVGVIFGNDPQAIVQDKRSHQSIYLKKDQMLEGFRVLDIQEGKVIFDRNGERFELNV